MSEEKSEDVTVKIPKAMADHIQALPAFKWFRDLEDFVVSASDRKWKMDSPKEQRKTSARASIGTVRKKGKLRDIYRE